MERPQVKFTYEGYRNLPDSETNRYELLEGELVMVPSPTTYHQGILRDLGYILSEFVRKHELGLVFFAPLDVVLSEESVLQPDILFISKGRSRIVAEENIQGSPDLVVEILSPATAERDRTYKRALYARHGVLEYWIVDPKEKSVEVLALGERGFETAGIYEETETMISRVLDVLAIKLSEVF